MSEKEEVHGYKMSAELRKARAAMGHSQYDAAASIGVSRSAVKHWENSDGIIPRPYNAMQVNRYIRSANHRAIHFPINWEKAQEIMSESEVKSVDPYVYGDESPNIDSMLKTAWMSIGIVSIGIAAAFSVLYYITH